MVFQHKKNFRENKRIAYKVHEVLVLSGLNLLIRYYQLEMQFCLKLLCLVADNKVLVKRLAIISKTGKLFLSVELIGTAPVIT